MACHVEGEGVAANSRYPRYDYFIRHGRLDFINAALSTSHLPLRNPSSRAIYILLLSGLDRSSETRAVRMIGIDAMIVTNFFPGPTVFEVIDSSDLNHNHPDVTASTQ